VRPSRLALPATGGHGPTQRWASPTATEVVTVTSAKGPHPRGAVLILERTSAAARARRPPAQAEAVALASPNARAKAFAAGGLHSSLNWDPSALIVSTFHLLLTSST
jgi:hypothetical protein